MRVLLIIRMNLIADQEPFKHARPRVNYRSIGCPHKILFFIVPIQRRLFGPAVFSFFFSFFFVVVRCWTSSGLFFSDSNVFFLSIFRQNSLYSCSSFCDCKFFFHRSVRDWTIFLVDECFYFISLFLVSFFFFTLVLSFLREKKLIQKRRDWKDGVKKGLFIINVITTKETRQRQSRCCLIEKKKVCRLILKTKRVQWCGLYRLSRKWKKGRRWEKKVEHL